MTHEPTPMPGPLAQPVPRYPDGRVSWKFVVLVGLGVWLLIVLTVGLTLAVSSISGGAQQTAAASVTSPVENVPASTPPPPPAPAPTPFARLNVVSWDGTPRLQQLVANGMSQDQAAIAALGVLLSGSDYYGAHVRLTNTGTLPIRIDPTNVLVHFGNQTARVSTLNDSQFLQSCVLEPDHYVEGLVIYMASTDTGAAMRMGGGGLTYADSTIEVTYQSQ